MKNSIANRVAFLVQHDDAAIIFSSVTGIEKECLRVTPDGGLAQTAHPRVLGSALSHQFITTDFSEALLEFVTPPHHKAWETHQFLTDLHQFTQRGLDNELLWAASMPCRVESDVAIPLARYGSSNVGQMKTVYRRGLGYRYGRVMQTIAGVHFNFSVVDEFWPVFLEHCNSSLSIRDFRSEKYLGLVRNFHRFGWLLLYLFGASPAVCRSFLGDKSDGLTVLDEQTYCGPDATSLRMSDLGYSNKNQQKLSVSLNSIDDYVRDLVTAINTPEPDYERVGVRVDGKYRQLNANVLQIENEFYSAIRPKRAAHSGESPTAALRRGGVEYVEVRSLDLNPYDPVGVSQKQMHFLSVFLFYCLLQDSPALSRSEAAATKKNFTDVARHGRDPGLELQESGNGRLLRDWARQLFDDLEELASAMSIATLDDSYRAAVSHYGELVANVELTPSARLLEELSSQKQSFFEFAMHCSESHRDYFLSQENFNDARMRQLAGESEASLQRQREKEQGDTLSFEEYLANYFAQVQA